MAIAYGKTKVVAQAVPNVIAIEYKGLAAAQEKFFLYRMC